MNDWFFYLFKWISPAFCIKLMLFWLCIFFFVKTCIIASCYNFLLTFNENFMKKKYIQAIFAWHPLNIFWDRKSHKLFSKNFSQKLNKIKITGKRNFVSF